MLESIDTTLKKPGGNTDDTVLCTYVHDVVFLTDLWLFLWFSVCTYVQSVCC